MLHSKLEHVNSFLLLLQMDVVEEGCANDRADYDPYDNEEDFEEEEQEVRLRLHV